MMKILTKIVVRSVVSQMSKHPRFLTVVINKKGVGRSVVYDGTTPCFYDGYARKNIPLSPDELKMECCYIDENGNRCHSYTGMPDAEDLFSEGGKK